MPFIKKQRINILFHSFVRSSVFSHCQNHFPSVFTQLFLIIQNIKHTFAKVFPPKLAMVRPVPPFLLMPSLFALLLHVLSFVADVRSQDSCYVTDSGHTCCDKALEAAMKSAMSGKDLLSSADSIQKSAEGSLGGKFETVVAFDDFAHKSHFKDGKSCKVEKDGQVALAWQP